MKKIYTAQTPQEAYLVKGILEEDGIPVMIQGEHMSSLIGGVPLSDTYPTVWVKHDEDEERAKALIEAFLASSPEPEFEGD
jgi:hypothetical protein